MAMNFRCVLSSLLVLAFGAGHPARTQEVQRVDVREDGLIGRFYSAVGALKRTGVLILAGTGEVYPDEAPSRDLARSRYPVFGIAYFRNFEGDPPELGQKQLRR